MYEKLNREYAGIEAIQDGYFNLLNAGGEAAAENARAYLDAHGELQAYWDDKDAAIAKDPLLKKYWASMELFERVSKDEFERQMEAKYKGVHDHIDEYYRIKDIDPEQAKEYLKTHTDVTDYWDARTVWTLGLDEEMMQMSQGITELQGEWGRLRKDTQPEMPGQQRVIDLIESGSRPMGDFELPEDMDARQVQAGIQRELDTYTGNWGALYRQLKGMGGLDRTLTAYQEFAAGRAGVETIMGNLAEAKALLTALSTINEGTVAAAGAGGGGGGGGRARLKSTNYGGASAAPKPSKAQTKQTNQRMDEFMAQLQSQAPRFYGMMRNLADMTHAEIIAFLEANTDFRDWLKQTGFSIAQLTAYFKRVSKAQAAVTPATQKAKSGAKATKVTWSLPK
jgi:hypothetical protein